MALFVTKGRKSPMAVALFVDLLFCLVFGGMYALTGVLYDHLPLGRHGELDPLRSDRCGGHCGLLHPVSAAG
ncbi:MAG: hypothetical protein ACLRVN_02975 [Butyricicoccus sp.]